MRQNPNYDVVKEPRGFIKCLEIVSFLKSINHSSILTISAFKFILNVHNFITNHQLETLYISEKLLTICNIHTSFCPFRTAPRSRSFFVSLFPLKKMLCLYLSKHLVLVLSIVWDKKSNLDFLKEQKLARQ